MARAGDIGSIVIESLLKPQTDKCGEAHSFKVSSNRMMGYRNSHHGPI